MVWEKTKQEPFKGGGTSNELNCSCSLSILPPPDWINCHCSLHLRKHIHVLTWHNGTQFIRFPDTAHARSKFLHVYVWVWSIVSVRGVVSYLPLSLTAGTSDSGQLRYSKPWSDGAVLCASSLFSFIFPSSLHPFSCSSPPILSISFSTCLLVDFTLVALGDGKAVVVGFLVHACAFFVVKGCNLASVYAFAWPLSTCVWLCMTYVLCEKDWLFFHHI